MAITERDAAFQMFLDAFNGLSNLDEPTIEELRRCDDDLFNQFAPEDATYTPVDAGGVPSIWVDVAADSDGDPPVLVWFHGGGYVLGSASGRRGIAAAVSRAAGSRALIPDYRRAPEARFPAAVEDARSLYEWLTDRTAPGRIVVGGDSAGGGLALALLLSLKADGLPMPAGAALVAPLVDFAFTGASHELNKAADPICSAVGLRRVREAYLQGQDPRQPLASPLYGDLSGLPAVLALVGAKETLLDDSVRLVERAQAAGTAASLRVYEDMFHLWPLFATVLSAGREAVDELAAFVAGVTRRS